MKQKELASKNNAEGIMKDAAKRLRDRIVIERPQDIDDENEDSIAKVAVTVDGTWQKEATHSSKIGMVFVISVDTGEILDYEVKSLFCHECKAHAQDKKSHKYKKWQKDHEPSGNINHKGDGSCGRSVYLQQKHNLKATEVHNICW